jgi:DNA ligase-1
MRQGPHGILRSATEDGCERLMCASIAARAIYRAGARGRLWIRLKREYERELPTLGPRRCGRLLRSGQRRGTFGSALLAAEPNEDRSASVSRCGIGCGDAHLAELAAKLTP